MAHVLRGMAAGLLAGFAASWAMNEFQRLRPVNPAGNGSGGGTRAKEARDTADEEQSLQPAQSHEPHGGENPQGGSAVEEDATTKTARVLSRKLFDHELTDAEKQYAGPAVHYAYGAVMGALYGGVCELLPGVGAGLGMPFGAAIWLLGDEIAVPALGLGKAPTEYPPEVHADALSAHLMYGATTDLLRRVLRHIV